MTVSDNTPIIVGVGEASERIDAADYQALSPVALAAAAAQVALDDAGISAAAVDVIAAIRQFEVSGANARPPFGASDNFPRSVGRRIGADPARAIWEVVGGQGPQHLVNEFAHAIAVGEMGIALMVGSEAISTVRHLQSRGETRNWTETIDGQLENRGFGMEGLLTADIATHGARTAIQLYALFENARRARLGDDRATYALKMGELFAPFTGVAARNPHAMSREVYSPQELATVSGPNRLTSDPFPRRMVARDQANQGAAVLMTSVGRAKALGIPEHKWIYLYGGADVRERSVIERNDLSVSPASVLAAQAALDVASIAVADIGVLDLYSCFPIAVFNICDGLGIAPNDSRGLTITGGLPFFGGAGNNYSMHAIAEMIRVLRARPAQNGFVGANGGFLSKYSVGVYGAAPRPWKAFDSKPLQAQVDSWSAPKLNGIYAGDATVETYTIDYSGPDPRAVVVARTADDTRIVAMVPAENADLIAQMISKDPLGGQIVVKPNLEGRTEVLSFSPA